MLHLSGIGKDYAKLDTNAARVKLVLDLLRGRGAAHAFRALDDVSAIWLRANRWASSARTAPESRRCSRSWRRLRRRAARSMCAAA